MVVAVKNCRIVKEHQLWVDVLFRCETCGYLYPANVVQLLIPSSNAVDQRSFSCMGCGKMQEFVIQNKGEVVQMKNVEQLMKLADEAIQADDYEKAVEYYRQAAEQGDAVAMWEVGLLYADLDYEGYDIDKAVEWYRKSVEAGNSDAMVTLGNAYRDGEGVEYDPEKAVAWYRKAAEAGCTSGWVALGYAYEHGHGVEMNWEEAIACYKQVADVEVDAMYHLGEIYENAVYAHADMEQALSCYREAAKWSDERAMEKLRKLEG